MAIVVALDKSRIRKSGQGGLHDGQFADPGVIIGDRRGADGAKAWPPLALTRPHLPAAAGLREQRVAEIARERPAERAGGGKDDTARFEGNDSQMIIDIDRKPMISRAFEQLMNCLLYTSPSPRDS